MNLARGNRITSHMGLKMVNDHAYRFPKLIENGYGYVEIPVLELWNPSEEAVVEKGVRNQYLKVIPACTLNVKGPCVIEVVPNPAIAAYGMIQGGYYVESGSGETVPSFYVSLRKDMDPKDVDYAIRLRMWEA